ncbi:hypothetical protein ACLOJK_013216 [Asimina triloba]
MNLLSYSPVEYAMKRYLPVPALTRNALPQLVEHLIDPVILSTNGLANRAAKPDIMYSRSDSNSAVSKSSARIHSRVAKESKTRESREGKKLFLAPDSSG